jgi:tetratricopeptide (TPR) repeat protein
LFRKLILSIFIICAKSALANNVDLADSVFYAGDYKQAIVLYTNCLKDGSDLSKKQTGVVLLRRGICFAEFQQNENAFNDYFKALTFFEINKNDLEIAKVYLNLSSLYFTTTDFTNTERYIFKAEKLFSTLHDTVNLIRVYGTKALLYNETDGSRRSIETRLEALNKFISHFDNELLLNYYFNLGNDYALFLPDSALYYYQNTISLSNKFGDSSLLPEVFINLGSIYLEKNNLPQAKIYLEKGLYFLDKQSDSLSAKELYFNLSKYYYLVGAYKKSYEYADSGRVISEMLYNKDKATIVAELNEKYEAEKKDATITEQKKENKIKTTGLIATGIGLGLVALLAAFSFKQYKKTQKANALLATQNDAIQNLNNKLHEANQTKASLFSIISHDLRAPLSSLYALLQTVNLKHVETANNEKVTSQTKELLDTMENLLLWSKSQLEKFTLNIIPTSLVDVFKSVESLYLPIITSKKIAVEHYVEGNGTINSDLDLLQVVCRNIYSNALQNAPNNTAINFHYQLLNDFHVVECSNFYDSKKVNNTAFFSEKGLGIIIIKDFCEKLQGTVHFTSGKEKFTVLLRIPSQKKV